MNDFSEKAVLLWQSDVERRRRVVAKSRGIRPALKAAMTVRDLPAAERPRERMVARGAEVLSGIELLACLLGRGSAGESVLTISQRLLNRFGDIEGIARARIEELSKVRGVGPAKAVQLKAACELSRRAQMPSARESSSLENPDAAGTIAQRYLSRKNKEHFIALLLDARHRLIRVAEISVGTLDMSVVHPRETFQEAIAAGAAALIVAHNHPSGDPTPSPEDMELTVRLIAAGALLGIPLLDHIVVGAGRNISFRNSGLWPKEE